MKHAYFRFYAELNDFLPAAKRQVLFDYPFELSRSVKDMIEALGIPHTEVDLILVSNSQSPDRAVESRSVDFSYQVQDGDEISVYPVFESIDITALARVRPQPLREVRFILDMHLGKLALYLRMLGFDTLYRNDYTDEELARISNTEGRILLTKDRGLLKRNEVTHGYYVRETDPQRQIIEILQRFDLADAVRPFRLCLRCNTPLQPVAKQAIVHRLPPRAREYYDEFHICPTCARIYWRGSHYDRMQRSIERLLKQIRAASQPHDIRYSTATDEKHQNDH